MDRTMGRADDRRVEAANEAGPTPAGVTPAEARDGSRPPQADATTHPDRQATARVPSHPWRTRLLLAVVVAGLAVGGYVFLVPRVETMLNTVSTDDAYVNGHVTFVAPRVAG